MRAVVQRLGLERPGKHVVTVAGTNGKGTTCHAVEQLALASGLTVGTTLSPHIDRINERFRINGRELEDAEICDALERVESARGDVKLTYFEYSSLVALLAMRDHDVDVAVLEIGLGGELDAFNVIDADIAVITSIGFDHQAILGSTLEEIGAAKAGILRRDQFVVLGPDMPRSVIERCEELGLTPKIRDRDFGVEFEVPKGVQDEKGEKGGWRFVGVDIIDGTDANADELCPFGSASAHNIATAAVALTPIVSLTNKLLQQVSGSLAIRGRLERRHNNGRDWLLDVAHNPHGIAFLCKEMAARNWHLPIQCIVLGMLEDKEHAAVAAELHAFFKCPIVCVDTFGERAFSAQALRQAIEQEAPGLPLHVANSREEAISIAESATSAGNVILALGSFSVVEQFAFAEETQGSVETGVIGRSDEDMGSAGKHGTFSDNSDLKFGRQGGL